MNEIVIVTTEDLTKLRKTINQSEKKIANSAQEFATIPESGVFSHIGTKEFDIPGVGKRISLGYFTTDGAFISENAIFASSVSENVVQVKNLENKGLFMLKQERVSPKLFDIANSQDKRMLALKGKAFKSTKVDGFQLKDGSYTKDKMFVKTDSAENKKKLLSLREPKTYYAFEIN